MARERKGAVITRGSEIYARIRFVDDTGKTVSRERKAKNRTDAKDILRLWLRDLDDGGAKRVLTAGDTFSDLALAYKERKLIPAEYHRTDKRVTKIAGLRSLQSPLRWLETLKTHFGTRNLRSITHASVEDYKLTRLRTSTITGTQRSITSVNRELELLRAMLRFAVRERMIISSPFADGEPLISKSDENRRERVLSYDEERRLLAACSDPITKTYRRAGKEITASYLGRRDILNALIVSAVDTAMRKGELLALKWSDIDFCARRIDILAFNTKTAKGRSVGMTPRVYEKLQQLWQKARQNPNDLVFGIEFNFKRSFGAARRDADLENFSFHDLRHTAITRMIQAGLSIAEVMKISGHTQMSTFARYVNPDGDAVQHIAERLAAYNDMKNACPVNQRVEYVS